MLCCVTIYSVTESCVYKILQIYQRVDQQRVCPIYFCRIFKKYVFDPIQPISTVFNAIIVYTYLCGLSGEVITDIAMVKIGYAIMNRARDFKDLFIQ